jgi:hypothetical protein
MPGIKHRNWGKLQTPPRKYHSQRHQWPVKMPGLHGSILSETGKPFMKICLLHMQEVQCVVLTITGVRRKHVKYSIGILASHYTAIELALYGTYTWWYTWSRTTATAQSGAHPPFTAIHLTCLQTMWPRGIHSHVAAMQFDWVSTKTAWNALMAQMWCCCEHKRSPPGTTHVGCITDW